MAVRGLQAARDALTFAYADHLIDDVEFALLFVYTTCRNQFIRIGNMKNLISKLGMRSTVARSYVLIKMI
jgi:hypothetical protein